MFIGNVDCYSGARPRAIIEDRDEECSGHEGDCHEEGGVEEGLGVREGTVRGEQLEGVGSRIA